MKKNSLLKLQYSFLTIKLFKFKQDSLQNITFNRFWNMCFNFKTTSAAAKVIIFGIFVINKFFI